MELMSVKNITRDMILLDLYRNDQIFYFTPATNVLSSLSCSIFINLILNDKIIIENNIIKIIDTTSIRTYNKKMLNYLEANPNKTVKEIAQDLFLDLEFGYELFELALEELENEGVIEIENKRQFLFNRTTISLTDNEQVREAYLKLFKSLSEKDAALELIALALVIDTFFDVHKFFSEEDYLLINEELNNLKQEEIYKQILVFKEVIDDFYELIIQKSNNYFGL